jgi:hypothetical protein
MLGRLAGWSGTGATTGGVGLGSAEGSNMMGFAQADNAAGPAIIKAQTIHTCLLARLEKNQKQSIIRTEIR